MNKQSGVSLSGIVWAIAGVVVLLLVIQKFAPGLWTEARTAYSDNLGWNENARKANPVGFLQYSKTDLQKSYDEISGIIKDLEIQNNRLKKEREKLNSDQGKYEEVLNRAKDIYSQAKLSPENSYPVKFMGAEYKQEEFMAQVKIIKNRNDSAIKQMVSMQQAYDQVTSSLTNMYEKRAKIQGAIEEIDTTIVIAKANTASADIQDSMSQIADINEEMNIYLGEYNPESIPIRGAEELINQEATTEPDQDLIEFLEGR